MWLRNIIEEREREDINVDGKYKKNGKMKGENREKGEKKLGGDERRFWESLEKGTETINVVILNVDSSYLIINYY